MRRVGSSFVYIYIYIYELYIKADLPKWLNHSVIGTNRFMNEKSTVLNPVWVGRMNEGGT